MSRVKTTTRTARHWPARPSVPMRPDEPLIVPRPPHWTEAALCAQTDPEAFFPEKGGSTAAAKRVCRRCPVRAECLEYALANDERFGIFGGLSERERRRVTRTEDGLPVLVCRKGLHVMPAGGARGNGCPACRQAADKRHGEHQRAEYRARQGLAA